MECFTLGADFDFETMSSKNCLRQMIKKRHFYGTVVLLYMLRKYMVMLKFGLLRNDPGGKEK